MTETYPIDRTDTAAERLSYEQGAAGIPTTQEPPCTP